MKVVHESWDVVLTSHWIVQCKHLQPLGQQQNTGAFGRGKAVLINVKKKKIAVDLKKFKRLQENIQAWTHKREATIPAKFVR